MGSDNAPGALLDAIGLLTPSLPSHIELAVIATPDFRQKASSLRFYTASEVISMEDNPLAELRRKKQSSISVGLRLLKQGALDAFISSGNTGALVSAAKMILGTFPGLLRPALLILLPTKKGTLAALDVGANLREEASHLVQFAYLGAAFQTIHGIKTPRVGLLNIGSEPIKGTSQVRLAYQKLNSLKTPPFSFQGNIEGKSVFEGTIDVLVADGFTGNVFLKTSEGIVSFILDHLNAHFSKEALTESYVNELRDLLHHTEYPGALLAGVKGTVIKCHGYASPQSLIRAIQDAIEFTTTDFVRKLEDQYAKSPL